MGDYLWALRDSVTREERILHYVIERKTWDDLSGSIEDLRILRQVSIHYNLVHVLVRKYVSFLIEQLYSCSGGFNTE